MRSPKCAPCILRLLGSMRLLRVPYRSGYTDPAPTCRTCTSHALIMPGSLLNSQSLCSRHMHITGWPINDSVWVWTNESVPCQCIFMPQLPPHPYLINYCCDLDDFGAKLRQCVSLPGIAIFSVGQPLPFMSSPHQFLELLCVAVLIFWWLGLKVYKQGALSKSRTSRITIRLLSTIIANSRNFSGILRSYTHSLLIYAQLGCLEPLLDTLSRRSWSGSHYNLLLSIYI